MKSELFKNELKTITSDDIRDFAKVVLDDAPDYFFKVAASSTGKYHPAYALGDGGLMRHTKAVLRIYNYIVGLEQYPFGERVIDLGRVACLAHDIQKSGTEEYYNEKLKDGKKVFTVFNHPLLAAEYIRNYKGMYLEDDDLEDIARLIETHMGQWNTDKRENIILPKPKSEVEKIVHLADYLASRKDIDISFKDDTDAYDLPDIETYKCPYKKHKDELLTDVAKTDPEYLEWLHENVNMREPMKTFVDELLKNKTN